MHDPKPIPSGPPPTPTQSIPFRFPSVTSDRAIAFMRLVGDLQVHVLIRLNGAVEPTRLARALRLLLDVEPVLGCRFVPGWHRPHWERLPDLDRLPLCELQETSPPAHDAAITEYLASPPDPDHMPMLRLRIFRQETGDTLVLKVNHLATDGGGSKECAYRLAALYNRLDSKPDLRPTPNLTGRRSLRQVAEQLKAPALARLLATTPRQQWRHRSPARFWHAPYSPTASWGESAPDRTYVLRRLDGDAFRRAKRWGQARGATVNDLLNAAYLRALLDWIAPPPDHPLRLRTTVDLRRYLPTGRTEAVCNCSSFAYPYLGPVGTRNADFTSLVDRMSAEMRRQKQTAIGLHEWAVLGPGFQLLSDAPTRRFLQRNLTLAKAPEAFQPALTNIGRIHPERLHFGPVAPLDAHATASVLYPPGLALSVTGFGDSLTLSSGFCASALPRSEVERLIEHTVDLLASVPMPVTAA